jgi:diacylglycerol kinase (ATP)
MKRIQVIINPKAGQDLAVLSIINDAFHAAGVRWDVSITNQAGDATRFARLAVDTGVDVVASYGGDGTVMEVASGLIGSDVPLAILPGGTANVLSLELGIPTDLAAACRLASGDEGQIRQIDMGRLNEDQHFILRVGIGLEAQMVEGADRDMKDRLGTLAYAIAALQAIQSPMVSNYRMMIDGEAFECEGISCQICNSGNLGGPGLAISSLVSVSDGLLDVFVIQKADMPSLLSLTREVLTREQPEHPALRHWQARSVSVTAEPSQPIQIDGEILIADTVSATLLPGAVRVIVPAPPA